MPAAAMPAVIAAAVLAGPLQASARIDLPARTPEQVLALLAGNKVHQLSGTLEETASLGLPQLPDLGPGSTGSPGRATPGGPAAAAANPLTAGNISQLLGFLTTPHTVRVYLDGPANQRVQVLDTLAERDVIRHGPTVWTYDSGANTATELTLPNPRRPKTGAPGALAPGSFEWAPGAVPTPAALAAELVKGMDPSTQLSLGSNTTVAGHSAYVLQLVPRTGASLIGKVSIAVDSGTGLPLRVTVTARGQDSAALEVGFSKLELTAPPASTFLFTPPPGTSVTRKSLPALPTKPGGFTPGTVITRPGAIATPLAAPAPGAPANDHPAVTHHATPKVATSGTGWATIVEAPAGTVPATLSGSPALAQLLQPVAGGHALSTTLFNVLITPEGAVFAGAVPLAALQQAAAAK